MGWIETTQNGKYRAGYRDPDGRVRHRTFNKESEAKRFLSSMDVDISRGMWIDPAGSKILMKDWVDEWWTTTVNLRPSTRIRYRYVLDKYLLPTFGSTALQNINPLHIRKWVTELSTNLSPASTKKAYLVLSQILKAAVESGLIGVTPCRGISLPRIELEEMRFINPDEAAALANAIDERYRPIVYLGAYGGLRWGEMAGLRVRRFDQLKAEVRVTETVVELDGRTITFGQPKTKAGRRTVPLPREVAKELSTHISKYCKDQNDLVVQGPNGGPLRKSPFRNRVWLPAIRSVGVEPLRIHDLRHTAVALWIVAGANPKQIATWAGHSSVSVVLDRYGHLFPDSAEDQRDVLGRMFLAARDSVETASSSRVIEMEERRRPGQ